MKGVIASAVIAVVIVAGSVAYTNHIDKVSRELGEINDRVMAFLYDGDYESAGDEIEKLVQYLDENRWNVMPKMTKIVLYLPQRVIMRILIKLK